MMEQLDFDRWFDVFLEEKGLSDLVLDFEDEYAFHHMPIQVIQEYLSFCNNEVQKKIHLKLIELDFCNMGI